MSAAVTGLCCASCLSHDGHRNTNSPPAESQLRPASRSRCNGTDGPLPDTDIYVQGTIITESPPSEEVPHPHPAVIPLSSENEANRFHARKETPVQTGQCGNPNQTNCGNLFFFKLGERQTGRERFQ